MALPTSTAATTMAMAAKASKMPAPMSMAARNK